MKRFMLKEKYFKVIIIIIMFIIVCVGAYKQPLGGAPDEKMKMQICEFIINNGSLPHGGDESIRDGVWGISYGFTPILSYIISALFMRIVMFFTNTQEIIVFAARFTSILAYIGTIIMIMKISEKLFKKSAKWIFIILVCCLPQFVFLGSYINNDSLAIFSISIIVYGWICGLESEWNIKSCIILAVGNGICALSYYNAYGFILTSIILFIGSYIVDNKHLFKDMIKKGILIFLIAFLIAGWWFIRSAIIYNGDFLGLRTIDEYAEKYAAYEYKPSQRETPNKLNESLLHMLIKDRWVIITFKSFIGVFGNMEFPIHSIFYYAYFGLFVISAMGVFMYFGKRKADSKKILLEIMFIINIIIPICLSIYYSFYSDFQPQGRYIMPILIPLMYFVTIGCYSIEKNIKKRKSKIK